jgi:hypothetical protein
MKKTLLFFLMAVSFLATAEETKKTDSKSEATIPLKILVIDAETGEPIPAVKVSIEKTKEESYTDFDGVAYIEDLTQGAYDIQISFISYEKVEFEEYLLNPSNNNLLVRLKP